MIRKSESAFIGNTVSNQPAPDVVKKITFTDSVDINMADLQINYSKLILENESLGETVRDLETSLASKKSEINNITAEMAKISDILIDNEFKNEIEKSSNHTNKSMRQFLYANIKIRKNIIRFTLSSALSILHLRKSGYFDVEWYKNRYKDVRDSGRDPVKHYYHYGAFEGRNPSANFNTLKYLTRHADVAKSGTNPLLHYVKIGKSENRIIEPAEDGS